MKELILFLYTIYLIGHSEVGIVIQPQKTPLAPQVISEQVVSKNTILDMINLERSKRGIASLKWDDRLVASAKAKACDLRDRNYWDHKAPDGSYSWHYFFENKYFYRYAGENLCRDTNFSDCMNLWMQSQKHRDNILDLDFKDVGVSECGVFIVQHFGSQE